MLIIFFLFILFIFSSIKVSYLFKIEPFSDFYLYWLTSLNFSYYLKGGFIIFFYSFFSQILKWKPWLSAYFINISFLILLYFLIYKEFFKINNLSIKIYGIIFLIFSNLITIPFVSFVNTDIPAFILFIYFFYFFFKKKNIKILTLSAFFAFLFSSMRIQLFLILSIFLVFLMFFSKYYKINIFFLIFILFFSLSGFLLHVSLLKFNKNSQIKKIDRMVPLYSGLLTTEIDDYCGSWTSKAVLEVKKDINKKLFHILSERLKQIKLNKIILCKLKKIIFYDSIFSNWLNYYAYNVVSLKSNNFIINFFEKVDKIFLYFIKTLIFLWLFFYRDKKIKFIRFLFFILTLSFFLVHIVLEIQPRYFYPYYLTSLYLIGISIKTIKLNLNKLNF